ncbi:DUF2917 domain-containing protein [Paraburkholderia caballeronis]|uniref:DUF2917 domain-containing protein n=1 Tax=Paraburkholderia caballeronis TaxID=416943 RepID=UPI0010D0AE64|nr:DUF2917 domain-containing protein [Paraburkholderia caballeronis]TDV06280.1 hypothetical protein C7408_12396 [Paraburkholderia caballeronis]TDV09782.1 hypothetical protein C7406_12596 [Paraburkholderia caballeronis]TDV32966.1 hypothetical protein C7404_10196 [Paraburkholderia caballeronis]
MDGETASRDVLMVGRGACRGVRVARGTVLTVRTGRVWVTVERDAADYWLFPGDALPLAAGERVWIGGWDEPVCCALTPLVEPECGAPAAIGARMIGWAVRLRRALSRRTAGTVRQAATNRV